MNWWRIIKAQKLMQELNSMLDSHSIDDLPIQVEDEDDRYLYFSYGFIKGRLIKSERGFLLYTLIDIYRNDRLVKSSYRVKLKKESTSGNVVEFSRSGASVPGPC